MLKSDNNVKECFDIQAIKMHQYYHDHHCLKNAISTCL